MDVVHRPLRASPAPLVLTSRVTFSEPPPSRDETLVRVRPGVYTARTRWEGLSPWERYLVRVHAFATVRRDAVFSHESAAALLGLPTFGHPRMIHIFDGRRSRSARYGDVAVHTSADERTMQETAGIRINEVEDVVVDLARVLPPALGVAVADAASRSFGLSATDLLERGSAQRNTFGLRRMVWVLNRATPLSESPGESISRVIIEWCGFPRPALQTEHRIDGRVYRSDFCWPDRKIIGESDGWLKYRGDNAIEALRAEKRREDALRRAGWHIARWDYAGALGVEGLRSSLIAAGLTPVRRDETGALASVGRNARSE